MKHHIDFFIKSKCAVDLLKLEIYPNAKEITESVGAYYAVRNHVLDYAEIKLSDRNIALVSVGDGRTPRTSALFAFRSAFTCFSMDPTFKRNSWPIDRLTVMKRKVEDDVLDLTSFDQVIICLVHSHAKMVNVLKYVKGKRVHIISMDCCVKQEIKRREPSFSYKDENIWSEKNDVKIWLDV